MTALAPILEAFFTRRLITERRASQETIASYRTAFCLLLRFAGERLGKTPSAWIHRSGSGLSGRVSAEGPP